MKVQTQTPVSNPKLLGGKREYPKIDKEWAKGILPLYDGTIQKLDDSTANEISNILEYLLEKTFNCELEGWRKEGSDIVKYLICPSKYGITEIQIRILENPDGTKGILVKTYMNGTRVGLGW